MTEAASEPDEFRTTLTALAQMLVPGGRGIVGLERRSGGASQETWTFAVEAAGAPVRLVLRRSPRGRPPSPTALPLETEALMMRLAGEAGVPSPPVVHVLTPEDGLGRGFVMGHVDGETLGRRIVRDVAFAQARVGLARRCGEVLALIHGIKPGAAPGVTFKPVR